MRLYLIRHGETAFNRSRVMQGHDEIPLNDTGIEQAARLGRRFEHVRLDHIYASDLRRATMTAAILAAFTETPITYYEGFRERHPGELTGVPYDRAMAFFTDPACHPRGGESVPDFADRVVKAFDWLVEREGQTDRHVAVVTHGMVCGAFLRLCIGMPLDEIAATVWPNTCVTTAEHNGAGWQLLEQGCAAHLEGMEAFVDHATGG